MAYILAYDFGTGGIKASLYTEAGECPAEGFAAYGTFYPAQGFHEQRPLDWWQAIVGSTRELLAKMPEGTSGSIKVIGISGHSLGVVPMDANGELLRESVPIWSDSRPDTQPAAFFEHISEEDWYTMTGSGFPPPLYSIFKLMWFRDNEPEMFSRIHKVLGTKDYINFRLTGVMATDQSYASGSGVYDLKKRIYSDSLLSASGISGDILATIVPSTEILGTLTPEAATQLGLQPSTKVVAGGVDNSCMSLGAGAYREGRAYNSLGTSSWIAVSSATPLLDIVKRPYVFDHVVPDQYVSALAIFSAGSSHAWVANQFCHDLERRAAAEGISIYQLIDEEAATSPVGSNGVLFNPTLAGGNALDITPDVRGAFLNLDLRHTRADLLRATMEGISLGLRNVLDELRALTRIGTPLTLVGGGANSPFWRQVYADVYHIPVVRTRAGQQAAAMGAAVIAGVGAGIWDSYGVVDEISAETGRNEPNLKSAETYEGIFTKYKQAAEFLGKWAQ
ncbi:MAG: FGGY-family carbohydrate kinase [bacterium]